MPQPENTAELRQAIEASGVEMVRFSWCDTHGMLRGKTLMREAALQALESGVGMVSTLMLKDTSDRTAFKVFEASIAQELPGFEYANNLLLWPMDCARGSFHVLPWAQSTGWVQCQPRFQDGAPTPYDTRQQLQSATAKLAMQGLRMVCGLEVEFHVYKIVGDEAAAWHDPALASWPPAAPSVALMHPGYNLLSEQHADLMQEPFDIIRNTCQSLGLPLISLEIELGPSQVEAVFSATDALQAADNMVLFRSAVRQALRRKGYHATFMCRPPFDNIMSSGWHLHQSLVHLSDGRNAFMRQETMPDLPQNDARQALSELGSHYLAGLLEHAPGMTLMCTPSVNGFGRFRPNALAPQWITWGRDNRGAMLRVIGEPGDSATRIENRLGEPAANPYLYMAAQIHAGLDGIERNLLPGEPTRSPYAVDAQKVRAIPNHMADALKALEGDAVMNAGFGPDFVRYYQRIKSSELHRHDAAEDKLEFQRREYFART